MKIDWERFTIWIIIFIIYSLALICLILVFRKLTEVERRSIEPEGIEMYDNFEPELDSSWMDKYINEEG